MSHVAEGFERLHVPEKLQFDNVARGSSAAVHSLLYVVEDTYASLAARSASLRQEVIRVGTLLTGLIQPTQQPRPSQKTPYANPNS